MFQEVWALRRLSSPWLMLAAAACTTSAIGAHAAQFRVTPLADINPDGNAGIGLYGTLTDRVVLKAFDGVFDQLFSTDGTSVVRLDVGGINNPRPEILHVRGLNGRGLRNSPPFRGELYFVANGSDGRTLYKTDGLTTMPVLSGVSGVREEDIYLPPVASISANFLYFERTVGDDAGLYRTDGVAVSRVETSLPDSTGTRFFANLGSDAILFSSGANGGVFFRENATSQSAIVFDERIDFPSPPTLFQDCLYFAEPFPPRHGLLRTDGSTIVEVPSAEEIHGVHSLFVANDMLYFKARGASGYEQVYRTAGEQVELFDLSGRDQHATRFIGGVGNDLYLFQDSERRIVRTDGESIFEVSVDIRPDVGNASLLGVLGDTLLLDLQVADTGVPFSVTRGLFLLKDDAAKFVDIGRAGGYAPSNATVFGDDVFFTAYGANGEELFRLNGDEMTEYDINPNGDSRPANFRIIDDLLFFSALGPTGRELYVTDGGPLQIVDLDPTADASSYVIGTIGDAVLVGTAGGAGTDLFALRRVVPEPAAWLLLLAGVPCMLARRRRSRLERGQKF